MSHAQGPRNRKLLRCSMRVLSRNCPGCAGPQPGSRYGQVVRCLLGGRRRATVRRQPVVANSKGGRGRRYGAWAVVSCWGCSPRDETVFAAALRLRAVIHAAGSVQHHITDACWQRRIQASALPVAEYAVVAVLFAAKQARCLRADYRKQPIACRWPTDVDDDGELVRLRPDLLWPARPDGGCGGPCPRTSPTTSPPLRSRRRPRRTLPVPRAVADVEVHLPAASLPGRHLHGCPRRSRGVTTAWPVRV